MQLLDGGKASDWLRTQTGRDHTLLQDPCSHFHESVAAAMTVEDPEKNFDYKHYILRLQSRTRSSVKPPGT